MKVYLGVNTLKGFYKECYYDGNTVKAVLDRVIPELEKMPDTISGEHLVDWVEMTIIIRRNSK